MARKAKKKVHKMPPLSLMDKVIYWLILLVLCAAYVGLVFGPFYFRNEIALADDTVIAVAADSIWHLVTFVIFFLITFILWQHFYGNRKPIFGKRNFKYGPPAWPQEYPLFMKNKPYVFGSEKKRETQKKIAMVLTIVLLISFIPFPWSLYERSCLRADGSIVQYNGFNQQTQEFTSGEIEQITIETYSHRHRRRIFDPDWNVRMVFTTDCGEKYTFKYAGFPRDLDGGYQHPLVAMANIKQRYSPEIIRYAGVADLHNVIADNSLTEEEAALLYRLFEQH